MAIPNTAEYPGAMDLIGIVFGIQYPVHSRVDGIDPGIFCMEMENRIAQRPDCRHRINSLPYQMTGVKVCSQFRAYRLTDFQHCFHIIDAEAWMHLKSNLVNAMILCKRH